MSIRSTIKKHVPLPWPVLYIYRKIYYAPKDVPAAFNFLFHATKSPTSFWGRLALVYKFYSISYHVDCPHTEHELLTIAKQILNLGPAVTGTIVEAGSFHGGSTAKLSLVAKLCGGARSTYSIPLKACLIIMKRMVRASTDASIIFRKVATQSLSKK